MKTYHADYEQILRIIPKGVRVLDLGCGDGELLCRLIKERQVVGNGVDIDPENILECVRKGLSVVHGDLDEGLAEYPDKSYDFVVLNRTMQVTRRPDYVIKEMLRVGKKGIVSFPNFGYWKVRHQLGLLGRMPVYGGLPFQWYETANIHLVTIKDFRKFCKQLGFRVVDEIPLLGSRRFFKFGAQVFANILAEEGMFVLEENHNENV